MKKFQNKKTGFTIIEMLIAVFILEVAILGLASFYASSIHTTRIARNETIASNLAAGLLDEELAKSYDLMAVGTGSKSRYSSLPDDPFFNWYKKIDINYIDFQNLTDSATDTNMKKVVVTVYWSDGQTEKSFQTASIKTRQ